MPSLGSLIADAALALARALGPGGAVQIAVPPGRSSPAKAPPAINLVLIRIEINLSR